MSSLPNRKVASTAAIFRAIGTCDEDDLHQILAANVEFTWRYFGRLALMRRRISRRMLLQSFMLEGAEHLQHALAVGRGAMVVSAHLGDFDLAGSWLADQTGAQVVAVVDTVAQAARQRLFDDVRSASGIILRHRQETGWSDLAADLGLGRIVVLMLDRASPSATLETEFLGLPARLSVAPALLARRTGATALVGSTTTVSQHQRVLRFCAPVSSVGERSDRALMTVLADDVSHHIRACPWQWHIPAELEQMPFTDIRLAAEGNSRGSAA